MIDLFVLLMLESSNHLPPGTLQSVVCFILAGVEGRMHYLSLWVGMCLGDGDQDSQIQSLGSCHLM